MNSKSNKPAEMTAKEYEKLGREMTNVYETLYINKKRLYTLTFFKGIFYGFGIFLGGTLLVALLLWGLSYFDEVPVVEKVYNAITNPTSVQNPNSIQN